MIRLFVAIPLPEAVRLRLTMLSAGVPGARWTKPENLHLTLRFIGEVPETEFSDIADILGAVDGTAVEINLAGVGQFGDRRRVRVLWAGVDANAELRQLRERVEGLLQRVGVEPDRRNFAPHVTLARLQRSPMQRVGRFLVENSQFEVPAFTADRFVLFSSHLGQAGAIHTAEVEYPLREAGA